MYWHKKKDMRAGGLWRCGVRKREVQNAVPLAVRRAWKLRYWHSPNGGYVRRRTKQLQTQRAQILDQLAQLAEEAHVAQP